MNIIEFRKNYPQYDKVPDKELITALHKKYYADKGVDINTFTQKFSDPNNITPTGELIQQLDAMGTSLPPAKLYVSPREEAIKRNVKRESDFLKAIKEGAPEDIGGLIGGSVEYLPLPKQYKMLAKQLDIPLAAAGGYAGKFIGESYKAIKDPNVPYDLGKINFQSLHAAKRQAAFQGVGDVVSAGIGSNVVRHPFKTARKRFVKSAIEEPIPELNKMQGLLIEGAREILPPKVAENVTLTLSQASQTPMIDFLEGVSEQAIGGKKIRMTKQASADVYEHIAQNKTLKAVGAKGSKTTEEFGRYAQKTVEEEHTLFKAAANKGEADLRTTAAKNFGDAKIVDLSELHNIAKTEISKSKYFAGIGEDKIYKQIAKVPIEGRTKLGGNIVGPGGQKLDSEEIDLLNKLINPKGESQKISYNEAIELYRRINKAGKSIAAKDVGIADDIKRVFGTIQGSLASAMERTAVVQGKPEIFSSFREYNKWFSQGAKRFESDIGRRLLVEAEQHPNRVVDMLLGENSEETLKLAEKAFGGKAPDAMKQLKGSFLEGTFKNAQHLDETTNKMITHPQEIQKTLDALNKNPAVRKKLISDGEWDTLQKTIRLGLIIDAPSGIGTVGKYIVKSGQLSTATGLAAAGITLKKPSITATGMALLFGPKAMAKISTDAKLVDLMAKIERPLLDEIPKSNEYLKKLYNILKSDPAITTTVRLIYRGQKEQNDFEKQQ